MAGPMTFDIRPQIQAELARVGRQMIRQTGFLVLDEIVPQMVEIIATEANSKTAQTVQTFCELIERGVADAGPRMEAANSELASGAQRATLAAYNAARSRLGRNSPPYRQTARAANNLRYAGGFLEGALGSSGFAVGTAEGILFGNTAILNAAAKQWARLNFGAGEAAGEGLAARTFSISWSNLEVASLGIEDAPRPAFRIPKGYWFGQEFYPIGELPQGYYRTNAKMHGASALQKPRTTKGIKAEHWLDDGLAYIGENLGDTYRAIVKEIYDEARAGAVSTGRVAVPRPGRPRTSVSAE